MKKIITLILLSCFTIVMVANHALDNLHSEWNVLIQKNVSNTGVVNYDGFKSSETELDKYLSLLESNPPKDNWSKEKTMAYWINAYNAYTVKLILRNMPLKSIMEINEGKAWDLAFIPFSGKKISLNHIEHKILREKYKDPRIHFAVNCASFSCPKLSNKAFTEENLNQQLESLSRSFINNPKKNVLSKNAIQISQLFNWYKSDFASGNNTVIPFINKYANTKVEPSAKVEFLEYNWNLNN